MYPKSVDRRNLMQNKKVSKIRRAKITNAAALGIWNIGIRKIKPEVPCLRFNKAGETFLRLPMTNVRVSIKLLNNQLQHKARETNNNEGELPNNS